MPYPKSKYPPGGSQDTWWRTQVAKYNAIRTPDGTLRTAEDCPADQAIWFEWADFGWILSPRGENGARSVLLQY